MASLKCISCGHKNLTEARFCASCGASLLKPVDQPAPAIAPSAEPAIPETAVRYMGFWIRLGAAVIDGIVIWFVCLGISILILIYIFSSLRYYRGPIWDLESSLLATLLFIPVSWLYYWLFTGLRGQTLGKMVFGIRVANVQGSVPGLGMAALREIPGKILSFVVIFLGFLWIIWDGRNQGWHDKIAKTYVFKVKSRR